MPSIKNIIIAIITITALASSAPVIITGKEIPSFVGQRISSLRVLNVNGKSIPFQVDEVTAAGEYVLPMGERGNGGDGDGVFGERDEIVFIWDDASVVKNGNHTNLVGYQNKNHTKEVGYQNKNHTISVGYRQPLMLTRGNETRFVIIAADPSIPLSPVKYIQYDHASHRVGTPYYYAEFAKDRFHFTRAGVKDHNVDNVGNLNNFVDLTNELRVSIDLRTLFGLVPVRYTEDNLVCFVRRYKAGAIRLIRRGDFHLSLGFGVRGSKAAVNQICYPQSVGVPVRVNLPVRFRSLFSRAHIEMTPVIRAEGAAYRFAVPSERLEFSVDGGKIDTLHIADPNQKLFTFRRGNVGYGWLLSASMKSEHTAGSGFVMRRPPSPSREGIAECGFRLVVRDVPRGNYYINNWVFFSAGGENDIERLSETIKRPVKVKVL